MRWWQGALGGAAALLATAFVGLASWDNLSASPPHADPRRPHQARILRDDYGVPHIFGRSDADVAYGIAVAHATDDFRNIEEVLAAVRGRLGAITGADGAKFDFAAALTEAEATATAAYPTLAPATRALIEAYAQGLNDYAASHPGEVRLRGLFPVTGHDIVAGFVLRSPFFYGLDRPLGALADGKLPPRDAGPADERGSNAFAVAARRSGDGTTRLIVNSHQPWEGGVSWYELVVHSDEGWDFAGATFPGAPFPLLGHNRVLGWANTVNRPDLIDIYRLELNPAGDAYRLDGRWRPLEKHWIWLRVKVGPLVLPVPRQILRSVHGPVIKNALGAFAIRYAGIGDGRQVEQYYRLNKARSFDEWRQVMRMQQISGTNFIYADAAGHVGIFYNAKFPQRRPGVDWQGVLPGDRSDLIWTGYRPWDASPHVVDPPAGWVGNANNTPFLSTAPADEPNPGDFPAEMGIERYVTNRTLRYQALFAALGDRPVGRDALLAIKFDKAYAKDGWAGRWVARLLAVKDPATADARALLGQWDWTADGQGSADTLAVRLLAVEARASNRGLPPPDPAETLAEVRGDLIASFGRLDVPLADSQRLRRGPQDLPVFGGPDTLRAIYAHKADDGRRVADNGDGFIMLVEFGPLGVQSQSIHQFGAATIRPGNRHYADQSPLFARQQWKPVRLERASLDGHIESDVDLRR